MGKIPLWVKYGSTLAIISACIGIIGPILNQLNFQSLPHKISEFISSLMIIAYFLFFLIPLILMSILSISANNGMGEFPLPNGAAVLISILFWFIIGSLIGYIIQRWRNRKNERSN